MIVQIGTVSDQYDGGAFKVFAFHQQTGQVKHREALSAACGPEVSSPLAISPGLLSQFDGIIQPLGSIVLRIAANDLLVDLRAVGQVNKVADNISQPILTKHSLHQSKHTVDTVNVFCQTCHPAPGIKEFIGGKERPGLVVDTIGEHAKGIVFKQFGNIPPVANGQLPEAIIQGGLFPDGALEFKHHHRKSVDVKDAIRNAFF